MPYHKRAPVLPGETLPVVGPWISRLGQIHDIFANPDIPDPEIWVKAAFIASPRLLYLPIKPFLLATEWHIRTGRSHRPLKGIAKIGAEFTPQYEGKGNPGWKVFKGLGDLALKAEWYFMIIDRTLEFLVNWSSLAYIYQGHKYKGESWVEGVITGGELIVYPDWTSVGPFKFVDSDGNTGWNGVFVVPAGWTGVIKFSADVTPKAYGFIPKCQNFNFRVFDYFSSHSISNIQGNHNSDQQYKGADATFFETLNQRGHAYNVQLQGDFGALAITNINFGLYSFFTGTKGLLFDP